MGADFDSCKIVVPEGSSLAKEFLAVIQDRQYEYGHRGYTGTFAETPGVEATDLVFETEAEAWAWLEKNVEKWAPAKAVRVKDKPAWYIGALCSS